MKTAFIDTSVISECHRQGIAANILHEALTASKLIPVVGMYPTYEITRTITTDCLGKASQLFSFIRDLEPEFSCLREELYAMEAKKLKTDNPVDYLLCSSKKTILQKRIDNYIIGTFDQEYKDFIQIRQTGLTVSRQAWRPIRNKEIRKKYNHNFNKFLSDFFSNLKFEPRKIEWIRIVISVATQQKVILADKEIIKFIDNQTSYPALRTLIYVYLYLEFLTETNNATPSEDRFTDALVMIEGAYCTTIISDDESFIHKVTTPYNSPSHN